MLNKQPKKSNLNIHYSIANGPPSTSKLHGQKMKKSKPVKEKLHTNLSQLPISIIDTSKENISMANLMAARPYSSLVGSDASHSMSKSKSKGKMKKVMRKISTKKITIGLDNDDNRSQIKNRRLSGPNYSFNNKLANRANRSSLDNENQLKMRVAQNRKRYNLSCGDMIENRNASKSREHAKSQVKNKKKSKISPKNKLNKKQTAKSIHAGNAISNNAKTKTKKWVPASKSKGSTVQIATLKINVDLKDREKEKQKGKKKKDKKSKVKAKKSTQKLFIFSKQNSDVDKDSSFQAQNKENRLNEFPINKYTTKNRNVDHYQNTHKLVHHNYAGIFLSGSSVIHNYEFSDEREEKRIENKTRKITTKSQELIAMKLKHLEKRSDEFINYDEIRYYENQSPKKETSSINFNKLSYYSSSKTSRVGSHHGHSRRTIFKELEEEYIALNSQQLNFLSAVVLIQRQWRQHRLRKNLREHVKRNVKTEYIEQEHPKNNEEDNKQINKSSSFIRKNDNNNSSILNDKDAMMSRTKIEGLEMHEEVQEQKKQDKKSQRSVSERSRVDVSLNSSLSNHQKQRVSGKEENQDDSQSSDSPSFGYFISKKSEQNSSNQINIRSNRQDQPGFINQFIEEEEVESQSGNFKKEKSKDKEELQKNQQSHENIQIVNYLQIYSNQIFPDLTYLQYRATQFKEQLENQLDFIIDEKNRHTLAVQDFQNIKNELVDTYKQNLGKLKKTKNDIKKGYLKYIDCLNVIKGINPPKYTHKKKHRSGFWLSAQAQTNAKNEYVGLKRVSSQDGFISQLYNKLFQFDYCLSEWSKKSSSIELLQKKILIRKQFIGDGHPKIVTKHQRNSLGDLRSLQKNRNSMQILRNEETEMIMFDKTERIKLSDSQPSQANNESIEIAGLKSSGESLLIEKEQKDSSTPNQFFFSSEMLKYSDPGSRESSQKNSKEQCEVQESGQASNRAFQQSNEFTGNAFSFRKKEQDTLHYNIEQQIFLELARQLQEDLNRINPSLVDMILINEPYHDFVYGDEDEEEDNYWEYEGISNLRRSIQQMKSPRQKSTDMAISIIKTPEMEVKSSQGFLGEGSTFSDVAIKHYIQSLIDFILSESSSSQNNHQGIESILHNIIQNLNNNQSFQPLTYLRFLRDFEIPEDEYQPIISNENFIEWENYFINSYDSEQFEGDQEGEQVSVLKNYRRQAKAIFHRCVFESFLSELERNRPYGQRGKPFPWEQNYTALYSKIIKLQQIPFIFAKCLDTILFYLECKCGIIDEKYLVTFEHDLDRLHEQNEDRIIDMLERELNQSKHNWYQVEEHVLEINMEISFDIQMFIIAEMCEQIHSINKSREINNEK